METVLKKGGGGGGDGDDAFIARNNQVSFSGGFVCFWPLKHVLPDID